MRGLGRQRWTRGAVAAAALPLALVAPPSLAQAPRFDAISPVTGQPDNPGTGQETGADGLPSLRRLPDGPGRDLSGRPLGGEPAAGPSLVAPSAAPAIPGLPTLDTRVRSGGTRTGGVSTGQPGSPNYRGPTALLRQRAAPPRRIGTATRRVTQEVTQVPIPALRLTPVVQTPVVGVPLPAASPGPASLAQSSLAQGAFGPNSAVLGLVGPGALTAAPLRRPNAADDPYAPLGLRLGTFTVLPSFTQSLGYDDNPDQTTRRAARGSVALRSEGELNFRSDWSSSELAGELRAGYLETPQNEAASRPNANGTVRLRIDVERDLRVDAEGRFLVDTQRTGSPNLLAQGVTQMGTGRPLIATYGGTVGATQTFNRLSVSLRGSVDRSEFEDARLSDGTVVSQADRNLNQYGLRLRTAYEISPVVSPFVDLLADTRVYDLTRDVNGLRRDSDGVAVTAGLAFAIARTLTGEVSGGIQRRTYVDPSLRAIDAPLLNAALVWSASPLTTVRLNGTTTVTETTVPGSSGILTEAATLEVQHDLLRNLAVTLGGSYLHNAYQGSTIRETGFSATARLDYRFTRWLTLRGTYVYQQIDSTSLGSSFKDNTFLLGLRINP